MREKKEKIIYSRWLAVELRKLGFEILRTEVNPNHPQFNCWVFELNDNFNKALSCLVSSRK